MNDFLYRCVVCHSSSETATTMFSDIQTPPSQWVYCYSDGKQKGICNICFEDNKLDDFSPFEIEYLKEQFKDEEQTLCSNKDD